MVETTIAQASRITTPDYIWRGRGLFETYHEDLRYLGAGHWLIPSGSQADKHYEVRVGIRRPSTCECTGYQHHGHCSHIVCAERAHKRSATCDCCGERRWWSHLHAVEESDGLLSWYPGDVICTSCAENGYWA